MKFLRNNHYHIVAFSLQAQGILRIPLTQFACGSDVSLSYKKFLEHFYGVHDISFLMLDHDSPLGKENIYGFSNVLLFY